jgi:hypothetical protein
VQNCTISGFPDPAARLVRVSADLKGSQFSRFGCEPESLSVVAEHTNAAAAVEDKQSRLRVFSQPND